MTAEVTDAHETRQVVEFGPLFLETLLHRHPEGTTTAALVMERLQGRENDRRAIGLGRIH